MSIRKGDKIIAGSGVNDIFPIGVPFPTPYTSDYIPEGFVPANGQEYKGDDYLDLWDNWLGKSATVKAKLYAWEDTDPDHEGVLYSLSENPQRGDDLYWEDGQMDPNQKVSNVSISSTDVTYSYIETSWNYMCCNRNPALDVTTEINTTISGGKLQTITYEQFANEVTINGFCMKFAIDPSRKMFRVPQIPDGFTFNVESLAGVRGNGKTLGLMDGTSNAGLDNSSDVGLRIRKENFNKVVGSANGTAKCQYNTIGITQHADMSGMVAEIKSSTSNEVRWFIKLVNSTIATSVFDYWNAIVSLQNKFKIVDQVPTNPESDVFYCIPEKAE